MSKRKEVQANSFSSPFDDDGARNEIQSTRVSGVNVPVDFDTGKKSNLGVSLTASEIQFITDLAGVLGTSRHALLKYAVRRFLVDYRDGKVDLTGDVSPPERVPKNKLNIPS